jgi:hypothetical protein
MHENNVYAELSKQRRILQLEQSEQLPEGLKRDLVALEVQVRTF